MNEPQTISGGYYLKARCIEDNEIAHAPPHAREIFDYFLRNAFWKDGEQLKRGQLLTSYKAIQDDLRWYIGNSPRRYKKHQIETAVKLLARTGAVTTAKTTRGMRVTVCNYCRFQDPDNYENHSETYAKQKRNLRESPTIDEEGKKEEENREKNTSLLPGVGNHSRPAKRLVENSKRDDSKVLVEFECTGPVKAWGFTERMLEEFRAVYENLNVLGEVRKAKLWLTADAKRKKTARGMRRFVTGWLARAVDRGRAGNGSGFNERRGDDNDPRKRRFVD